MAIYHMRIGNVSRKAGSAATATLAYITGEKVRDERLQKTFSYPDRRDRVQWVSAVLPDEMPEAWRDDPRRMIVDIECHEKQADARTAKKIEFALPRELTPGQQKELIEGFLHEQFAARGYGAIYAVHDDPEHHNPHVHVLIPARKITRDGWVAEKSKKVFKLDALGQRIPVIDKATGQQKVDKHGRRQWQRVTVSGGGLLERREEVKEFRAALERAENAALEQAGRAERVDSRSLADQGLEREPQIHVGPAAKAMEQRGEPSERAEMNREIMSRNAALARMTEQLRELAEMLQRLKARARERAHETVAALLARAQAQRAEAERIADNGRYRGSEQGTFGRTGSGAGAAESLADRAAEEAADRAEAALRAREERDAAAEAEQAERARREADRLRLAAERSQRSQAGRGDRAPGSHRDPERGRERQRPSRGYYEDGPSR